MYYDDFDIVNLMNLYINLKTDLQEVGAMYNGTVSEDDMTAYQKRCRDSHREGYDYGLQIYSIYGDIGAIMEVVDKRHMNCYEVEYENCMFGYSYPPRKKIIKADDPNMAAAVVFKLDPYADILSVKEVT